MIQFKRGDDVNFYDVELLGESGQPLPLHDITIKSQARTRNGFLGIDFTVVKKTTSYDLISGDTAKCPIGDLYMDIEYQIDGEKASTKDIKLKCLRDSTYEH